MDIEGYEELVAARKACRICVEQSPGRLKSSAEFAFDPPVVSLWEAWLGHRRPKLLVVGQDFGNVAYFVRNNGHDAPGNKTNENLHRLLAEAGIAAGDPPHKDSATPVFLTNSILCLKEGRIDAPLRASWVDHCTDRHLRALLELLGPPAVVGMGSCGWRAVRRAFALDEAPQAISQATGGSWIAADQTRVFAVVHCGPLGLTNRSWPQHLADWRQIGAALASCR
ncbi:MAG TPA: uracil-DNA glycosylase family protein [Stellaceae bacterium]